MEGPPLLLRGCLEARGKNVAHLFRPSTVWSDAGKNVGPHGENGYRLLASRNLSHLERRDVYMNKIVLRPSLCYRRPLGLD